MSINELIATSSVHAYNNGVGEGRRLERESIINALRNKETAKTLMVLAENTKPEHPKVIQNHAWGRIATVLEEEQK